MLSQFQRSFLNVPTFVARAYSSLESLSAEEFRARQNAESKALIEEVIPLTSFLKHFERPSRSVRCRLAAANEDHDARMRVRGPEVERGCLESHYFLEVTTAGSPVAHLKREALNRNGAIFGGTDIRAEGSRRQGTRRIISNAMVVDGTAAATDATEWVRNAIALKAAKTYRKPCIVVVNVEPVKPLTISEWSRLIAEVEEPAQSSGFTAIYLVHWGAGHAFGVHAG